MLTEALELYFEDIPASKVYKVGKLDVVPSVFKYA